MDRIISRLKNYIAKNKTTSIIIGLAILLFIIIIIFVLTMMPNSRKSVWGNRLDGISEHVISDGDIDKVKSSLKGTGKVSDVSYNLSGRTMNFIITVNNGVARNVSANLTTSITENLSSDIQGYYDIQVFFKGDGNDYPYAAYKHKTQNEFSFSSAGEE